MTQTHYFAWQVVPIAAAFVILALTWLRYR